jgi:ABC-type transport system involved in multi-copper enzyme maturation permease subunit
MIKAIIKREFLDNILSFKFIACVLAALIVISMCTFVLTADYKDRLKNYDKGVALAKEALSGVPVYSCLTVQIYKKPSPLSIFISGIERKAGSHVEFANILMEIPTFLRGGGTKNEFSDIVSVFDFSAVIIVVFTLLAILLSYNSISGEKEDGVLSLILSNSLPRYKLLLGKYLGGLISIAVPLALCFIWGILIVVFSRNVEVNGELLTSMGLLYLLSLIYLSFVLLFGIFISSRTKTSFISLLILLAFYLIFVFLLPQALRTYTTGRITEQAKNVEKNSQFLLDERSKKIEAARRNVPQTKSWWLRDQFYMELYQGRGIFFSRINPPEAIKRQKVLTSIRTGTEREYAEKIHELVDKDLIIENRIRRNLNNLLVLNPPSSFERTTELAADTGVDSINRFFQQINLYWHQYMRYMEDKGAFGLKYFYRGPEELTPYEKELIKKISADPSWQTAPGRSILYSGKYLKEAMDYKPNIPSIDLSDMPVFKFQTLRLSEKIEACFINMIVLIFYNLLFLILAHLSFNSYDPRKRE